MTICGLKGLKIIQDDTTFCFGIDSVLLSDYSKEIKDNSTIVDLGTGNGIISILLCGKTKLKEIIGVEIQENIANIAKENVALNNLEEKFKVLNCDLKNLSTYINSNSIDVVVTNPPYKKLNTGKINNVDSKLIARHEVKCTLEDVIKTSSYILKNNGSFFMVHKPDRLADIIYLLRKYHLEPKRMRLVYPSIGKNANLLLVKAVKNGNSFIQVDTPLYVYNADGSYTSDILKIYGKD